MIEKFIIMIVINFILFKCSQLIENKQNLIIPDKQCTLYSSNEIIIF